LIGLVMGLLAIRRQGIYFSMITLALAQMLFFVACRRRSPAARMACRACRAASCWADRPGQRHDPVLRRAGHRVRALR
jgi:hypothetical protein